MLDDLTAKIALVTGASRGIGRAAALTVAAAGADVAVTYLSREASARDPCAGIVSAKPLLDITEADWDRMLAVNLKSAFLVTQRVLPGMRARRWGRIVNLSSVAAQTGGVTGPHYAASKAGLVGLTHSYARHLVQEGITVNAIAPALIATDMVTGNLQVRPDLIPMGRFGAADEVAAVVVMLARNGYMTGQTINVNGGWYMS